jgi:cell division septation protein DedD
MVLAIVAGSLLAACEDGQGPFAKQGDEGAAAVSRSETSVRLIERDVEAPQVFQATDQALWDGRPSLGGVWVASPDAVDPERVILRNPANGKFVIGALFRRERLNPGPALQISSDAAAALGILAGQPAELSVTALRREEVQDAPAEAAAEGTKPILDAAETIDTTTLAATAGAAIARAEDKPATPVAAAMPAQPPAASVTPAAARATPAPAAKPAAAASGRALVQIGIFSVEANAKRAAATVDKAAVPTRVLQEQSQGKTFWRVVAGPAPAPLSREDMLAKVKSAGFGDAYFVSR